jgi:hypothetical protein
MAVGPSFVVVSLVTGRSGVMPGTAQPKQALLPAQSQARHITSQSQDKAVITARLGLAPGFRPGRHSTYLNQSIKNSPWLK